MKNLRSAEVVTSVRSVLFQSQRAMRAAMVANRCDGTGLNSQADPQSHNHTEQIAHGEDLTLSGCPEKRHKYVNIDFGKRLFHLFLATKTRNYLTKLAFGCVSGAL